jgi:hypothetical protein
VDRQCASGLRRSSSDKARTLSAVMAVSDTPSAVMSYPSLNLIMLSARRDRPHQASLPATRTVA